MVPPSMQLLTPWGELGKSSIRTQSEESQDGDWPSKGRGFLVAHSPLGRRTALGACGSALWPRTPERKPSLLLRGGGRSWAYKNSSRLQAFHVGTNKKHQSQQAGAGVEKATEVSEHHRGI